MVGTRIRLHHKQQALTAISPDEPCLALIRNDAVFNLLIAQRASDAENAISLLDTSWFCAHPDRSRIRRFPTITLARELHGLWSARDPASGKVIRRPSLAPYHVVFIEQHEFHAFRSALDEGNAGRIFSAAQRHFGGLPGFDSGPGVLISPKDYATVADLPEHDYLPE
jgi:hypothetical protein